MNGVISRMLTASGGCHDLDGSRVSPQLPKLPNKKSRYRGYAKGEYFVEH
jgi:cytochrome c553